MKNRYLHTKKFIFSPPGIKKTIWKSGKLFFYFKHHFLKSTKIVGIYIFYLTPSYIYESYPHMHLSITHYQYVFHFIFHNKLMKLSFSICLYLSTCTTVSLIQLSSLTYSIYVTVGYWGFN